MVSLALTGGIGSGKTTVANLIAKKGAHIIDADQIAHQLLAHDEDIQKQISAIFGPEVKTSAGIDRKTLAEKVFGSPEKLAQLNAIMHPRILQMHKELDEKVARENPAAVRLHVIPLLVENGWEKYFDSVLVVESPLQMRLAHLTARGMSEEEALIRMAHQEDDETRRAKALWVIFNDSTLEDLAKQVDHIWPALQVAQPFVAQTHWWTDSEQ